MKIVKKQETFTREKEIFIAKDGTEFPQEWLCREYERDKALEMLSKEVRSCRELEGFPPFDGEENMGCHSYRWYFVSSQEDADKINESYALERYQTIGESELGEWVCIETNDCGDAKFSRLSNCIDYAKNVLGKIGFEVTVTKKESRE